MKPINLPENISKEQLLVKLLDEKTRAVDYQKRRHNQWNENYLLYRDTVEVNRLTQRQAINIPLIKETVKTVLSRIDEEPGVEINDKGGDQDKELVIQEKWRSDYKRNHLTLVDMVDKKQVCLYGRSHIKHNWVNNEWVAEIKDIYDVVVDKNTKPYDIQTARYLVELNIIKPLNEIVADEKYDSESRELLKVQMTGGEIDNTGGKPGAKRIGYKEMAENRNERLKVLGMEANDLEIDGYDIMVGMSQHYTYIWDASKKKYVRYVALVADDRQILRVEPLMDAIGIEELPFETWADDLEAVDYWSDGLVDSIRTLNQTINIWVSQLVENRTLQNFGMNFYDATASEGFTPQGFDPQPGAWYPLPGKPADVYQRVEIGSLQGAIEEISFLVSLAEKVSATGAIDKGVVEQGKRTLGEIEIAVGKAMERTTSMSKYYKVMWESMVLKWYDILEANVSGKEKIKLYKKNREGVLKGLEFGREAWVSPEGYEVTIISFTEQLTEKAEGLQRLQAAKQFFSPENEPLNKAVQKRAVAISNLTAEEQKDVMDWEEQAAKERKMQADMAAGGGMGPDGQPIDPEAAAAGGGMGMQDMGVSVDPAAAMGMAM